MSTGTEKTGPHDETLADWLEERGEELERTYALAALGVEPDTYCPTGLKRLDEAGLLELGVATIVLGHEGDGKSALGLQFLEGCARAGYGAIGFYPEDPRRFVADRVYTPIIGESATALRRVRVDDPSSIPNRLRAARAQAEEWTRRVQVTDKRMTSSQILAELARRWKKGNTRLAVIDYAQVLSAEGDEKSVERVINGFVWNANEFAKEMQGAVVILSQVAKEVKTEGRKQFNLWKYLNPGKTPTREAVEGYRPLSGHGQWAPTALGQKARAIISWFRPNQWLREHGIGVPDDICEAMIVKNNYGAAKQLVRLKWDGPTTRITDPKDL